MNYRFVVIEKYRDGGIWRHFYPSFDLAEEAAEDMRAAHPGRRYEILQTEAGMS